MTKGIVTFMLAMVILPFQLIAQAIDTNLVYQLDEVIYDHRLKQMLSNVNVQSIDSSIIQDYASEDLATILNQEAGIVLVAYGSTGASNIRLRGGMSSHTAVIWNGFNITDPLLGMYNFSTSTPALIDEIKVQKGGGSAIFGGGAVGGTIHLNNHAEFNNGKSVDLTQQIASFSNSYTKLSYTDARKHWVNRFSVFRNKGVNDFIYLNIAQLNPSIDTNTNGRMITNGLQHEVYYRKNKQDFSAQYWFQNTDRQVAPLMTTFNQGVNIIEQWHRLALNWKYQFEASTLIIRNGTFSQGLIYINPTYGDSTNNQSLANISELIWTSYLFKNHTFNIGLNHNHTKGNSANFVSGLKQNRTAVYISEQYRLNNNLEFNASARRAYIDLNWKPVTYHFNSKYQLFKGLDITVSHSKSHLNPTFNDLYWQGGQARGNDTLRDETAYTYDFGIVTAYSNKFIQHQFSTSIYHSRINDLIQWLPINNVWMPMNQKKVHTHGLEATYQLEVFISEKSKLKWNSNYNYTVSTVIEKAANEHDDIIGKQNIYIPFHKINSSLKYTCVNTSLQFNLIHNGRMFTNPDNSVFIKDFMLANTAISEDLKWKKQHIKLSFRINNLFDNNYMNRLWYPMPGRNYQLEMNLKLN